MSAFLRMPDEGGKASRASRMGKDMKEEEETHRALSSSSSFSSSSLSSSSSSAVRQQASRQHHGAADEASPVSPHNGLSSAENSGKKKTREASHTMEINGKGEGGEADGAVWDAAQHPVSDFVEEKKWRGFSRREVVRLLLQCMKELGYQNAVRALEEESGILLESPAITMLHEAVLEGNWEEVYIHLSNLPLRPDVRKACWFLAMEQKYFEGVIGGDEEEAIRCLREDLQPAVFDMSTSRRVQACSALLMYMNGASMDGLLENLSVLSDTIRANLWYRIKQLLPPVLSLPNSRLAVLLAYALQHQTLMCLYHNTDTPLEAYSLLYDHHCHHYDPEPFCSSSPSSFCCASSNFSTLEEIHAAASFTRASSSSSFSLQRTKNEKRKEEGVERATKDREGIRDNGEDSASLSSLASPSSSYYVHLVTQHSGTALSEEQTFSTRSYELFVKNKKKKEEKKKTEDAARGGERSRQRDQREQELFASQSGGSERKEEEEEGERKKTSTMKKNTGEEDSQSDLHASRRKEEEEQLIRRGDVLQKPRDRSSTHTSSSSSSPSSSSSSSFLNLSNSPEEREANARDAPSCVSDGTRLLDNRICAEKQEEEEEQKMSKSSSSSASSSSSLSVSESRDRAQFHVSASLSSHCASSGDLKTEKRTSADFPSSLYPSACSSSQHPIKSNGTTPPDSSQEVLRRRHLLSSSSFPSSASSAPFPPPPPPLPPPPPVCSVDSLPVRLHQSLELHNDEVWVISCSPVTGKFFASGSKDRSVAVWMVRDEDEDGGVGAGGGGGGLLRAPGEDEEARTGESSCVSSEQEGRRRRSGRSGGGGEGRRGRRGGRDSQKDAKSAREEQKNRRKKKMMLPSSGSGGVEKTRVGGDEEEEEEEKEGEERRTSMMSVEEAQHGDEKERRRRRRLERRRNRPGGEDSTSSTRTRRRRRREQEEEQEDVHGKEEEETDMLGEESAGSARRGGTGRGSSRKKVGDVSGEEEEEDEDQEEEEEEDSEGGEEGEEDSSDEDTEKKKKEESVDSVSSEGESASLVSALGREDESQERKKKISGRNSTRRIDRARKRGSSSSSSSCKKKRKDLSCVLLWQTFEHEDSVSYISWSNDEELLASGGQEGSVCVWERHDGRSPIARLGVHTQAITALGWLKSGRELISGGGDKKMVLYSLILDDAAEKGWRMTCDYTWNLNCRIQDLVVLRDGVSILCVTQDRSLRIVDSKSRQETISILFTEVVYSICASALSNQVLLNFADSRPIIRLWDVDERRSLQRYRGHRQGCYVIRSSFGGVNEAFVVSGSEDSQIFIWHRFYGSLLYVLAGHAGTVNGVIWPSSSSAGFSGKFMVSASDDHVLLFWIARRREPRLFLPQHATEPPKTLTELRKRSQRVKEEESRQKGRRTLRDIGEEEEEDERMRSSSSQEADEEETEEDKKGLSSLSSSRRRRGSSSTSSPKSSLGSGTSGEVPTTTSGGRRGASRGEGVGRGVPTEDMDISAD